ncbi:PHD finger protein 7-like [Podargus strigoides]
MLCGRAEADPDKWGCKVEKRSVCAHVLCLIFSSELPRYEVNNGEVIKFYCREVQREIERAAQKNCCVCSKSGASINCHETGCERSFHLPCAEQGECVIQFLTHHRSFCWEHRPEQEVEAAPEANTTCLICLEPVGDKKSYSTLVCPACKHAWFHRGCIQAQALCAGITCFRCPLCRNSQLFVPEMLHMGIRIPQRLVSSCPAHETAGGEGCAVPGAVPADPALRCPVSLGFSFMEGMDTGAPRWEIEHGFDELSETHRRCDTRECLCPGGREHVESEGRWELLLCHTCSAEGTHRACSDLSDTTYGWECGSCAALHAGKRQSTQVSLGWGQARPGSGCPG